MVKVIGFILFIVVVARLATLQYIPCKDPITYKLGSIDPRFNLTEDQLRAYTSEAEKIWGEYEGSPLFSYDEASELTINLTYDERQALSSELEQLDSDLDSRNSAIKPRMEEYNRESKAFESKLAKLNAEVQYWNSQGGAPEDIYNRLQEEQRQLQVDADRLNAMAAELNQSTATFNAQVNEFNTTIQDFNQTIAQKPEEGLYDPQNNRIDIYFNTDRDGLVHTIAHELGHARGVDHATDDKDAIMYPYSTLSIELSEADKTLLADACKKYTYAELFMIRLPLWIERIQQELNILLAKV
jgi:predicted Zn-dependent protease